MARGWESKSVEAQQQASAEITASKKRRYTTDELKIQREHEGLLLNLKRIKEQLATVENRRRREGLKVALSQMEARLKKLKARE